MQYQPSEDAPMSLEELAAYVTRELHLIARALEAVESRVLNLVNYRQVADLPSKVTGGELGRVANELYVYDAGLGQWRKL